MSKVNTLYSYFQKTPAREKSSDSVGGSCKIDDNANVQPSSDVNGAASSKPAKSMRSSDNLSSFLQKKSTATKDRTANIGRITISCRKVVYSIACAFFCSNFMLVLPYF